MLQVTSQTTRQETSNVIEFFEEQEHSLEEITHHSHPSSSLLLVPSTHSHPSPSGSLTRGQGLGSPRSPSPSAASVGLHHLDNLIRLMEQLSNLKDENVRLRKKCDFLETTRDLMKARSELMTTSESSSASASTSYHQSLPPKRHKGGVTAHYQHHHLQHHSRRDEAREGARPRLSSAEDMGFIEISESASDGRPKRPKSAMHKRSFSTGSLEVEILDETTEATRQARIPKSKSGKSVFAKSPKQKGKSSKWARVKKVLTGQFFYEDLGTTLKSLKEFGRSPQRYSAVSSEGGQHDYPASPRFQRRHPHHPQFEHNTSLDPELLSSRPRPQSISPTPDSSSSATTGGCSPLPPGPEGRSGAGEELGTDIWMGPQDWWDQYEASRRQHREEGHNAGRASEASSSDLSSVIEVKTMYLGSGQKDTERLLRVKPLIRRRSSPSLLTKDSDSSNREDDDDDFTNVKPVHRASSYKGEEISSDLQKVDLRGVPVTTTSGVIMTTSGSSKDSASKKLHQKAWGRVKEIIHVRKDSDKKRKKRERAGISDREESSTWSQEETSEFDVEALLDETLLGDFGDGVMGRSTPRTSPMILPRAVESRTAAVGKSLSESPPQNLMGLPASAAGADMAALLG